MSIMWMLRYGDTLSMQRVMLAFEKRSALHAVLSQRVGNFPILSIMSRKGTQIITFPYWAPISSLTPYYQ